MRRDTLKGPLIKTIQSGIVRGSQIKTYITIPGYADSSPRRRHGSLSATYLIYYLCRSHYSLCPHFSCDSHDLSFTSFSFSFPMTLTLSSASSPVQGGRQAPSLCFWGGVPRLWITFLQTNNKQTTNKLIS